MPNCNQTHFGRCPYLNAYGSTRQAFGIEYPSEYRWATDGVRGCTCTVTFGTKKFDKNDDGFLTFLGPASECDEPMAVHQCREGWVSFECSVFERCQANRGNRFQSRYRPIDYKCLGSEIKTQRWDFSGKLLMNPEITYQSAGLQLGLQLPWPIFPFWLRRYAITHNSVYANGLYNSIISDSRHKVKTGISFTHDDYSGIGRHYPFWTYGKLGGAFEYAYDDLDALSLTAGVGWISTTCSGFCDPKTACALHPWDRSAFAFFCG